MTAFLALVRKQVTESCWTLGISASALFGLSWLFVFVAARIERELSNPLAGDGPGRPMRALRTLGGANMDFSSAAIEMALWNHPLIVLTLGVWAIGRGSAAVAAEVERGTMDLILSRPVSRPSYLASQVLVALAGIVVLAVAMVAGNQAGTRYNPIESPPTAALLLKPAANVAALALAIYGYTLFFSALDIVRWRPNLLGSVLTLAMFITYVVANLPSMDEVEILQRVDKYSIFNAYNPVELVTKGQTLAGNAGYLAGIGAAGIALAFLAFSFRDLPTNS
jgi:ABC-2 type transport system permease protein